MMKRDKQHEREQEEAPAAERQEPCEARPDELEAVKAERDDLLSRLQRVSADYLNYQKRVQKDVARAREFANEELIKALLGVLDDMERALAAARENHARDDPLLAGMQLVHDKA
ncbi:MAG TPA: nucleotide exchange factor GrpE, partial [Phycisphaerae bacterium]|nr:nucleotide exchange factor GrpE [Phycisphaerae bacterium]